MSLRQNIAPVPAWLTKEASMWWCPLCREWMDEEPHRGTHMQFSDLTGEEGRIPRLEFLALWHRPGPRALWAGLKQRLKLGATELISPGYLEAMYRGGRK